MSQLEYSSEAQNVLCAFEGTDCIVFCEGNPSSAGDDCDFWKTIFQCYCHKKIKIIPRGGKKELLHILNQEGGLPSRVYIVLDRDLEDIIKRIGKHSHLIYTYGYSYENDLYSIKLILDIIRSLKHLTDKQVLETKLKIQEQMKKFQEQVAPYMCAFAEGVRQHISMLPNPNKHESFDRLFLNKDIVLNQEEIKKCIDRLNTPCCQNGLHQPFDNVQYCNGHLLETFVYRVINLHCGTGSRLTRCIVRSLALRGFERFLEDKVSEYYRRELSALET